MRKVKEKYGSMQMKLSYKERNKKRIKGKEEKEKEYDK